MEMSGGEREGAGWRGMRSIRNVRKARGSMYHHRQILRNDENEGTMCRMLHKPWWWREPSQGLDYNGKTPINMTPLTPFDSSCG